MTSDELQQQPLTSTDEYDDGPGVDLTQLLTWVGDGKKSIATVTVVAAVLALVVGLLWPKTFTARATMLAPGSQQQSGSAAALAALPPVPLEAGDRILIPSRPGFVTVAGAVVNSNAFLWKPGRTAGEYLRLAGADEAAEPANMFILRADGTVSHAGDNRSFWGRNSLESQVMQPGDALIVPNQLDFETWGRAFVRNLKDFAQIFTGFGIGIAAIHSL